MARDLSRPKQKDLTPELKDLERRYRLLLADHIEKLEPVVSLGHENELALEQLEEEG